MKTLEEVRKIFEGDRFATENGAMVEEIGDHSATCSLMITESHRNAMGGFRLCHCSQLGKYGLCIVAF